MCNLTEYLSLDSHDREIDFWYYQFVFTDDQKGIRNSLSKDKILKRQFVERPNFSDRETDYFGQVLKTYSIEIIGENECYLCTLRKGEYGNYDVGLINRIKTDDINEKLCKASISYLFEIEYSEYLQHEMEKWVVFLSINLNTLVSTSVKKLQNSEEIDFDIESYRINSPNNA